MMIALIIIGWVVCGMLGLYLFGFNDRELKNEYPYIFDEESDSMLVFTFLFGPVITLVLVIETLCKVAFSKNYIAISLRRLYKLGLYGRKGE